MFARREKTKTPTVLQVQDARLADVLEFGAGRAELGLLIPGVFARLPTEHYEGPVADLAGLAVGVASLGIEKRKECERIKDNENMVIELHGAG